MFYYKNVQNITWDTMQKYFIRMPQLLHWTYIIKKIVVCLKFKFDWVSYFFHLATVFLPYSNLQGFPLTVSGVAQTFQHLLQRTSFLHGKRNLHFELRKYEDFHSDLVMLFSNIFSGLSLFTIFCELNLKSLFLISICLLR